MKKLLFLIMILSFVGCEKEDYTFEKDGDSYRAELGKMESNLIYSSFTAEVRRSHTLKNYTFRFRCDPLIFKKLREGTELEDIRSIAFRHDLSLPWDDKCEYVSGHVFIAEINRTTQKIVLEFDHFSFREDENSPATTLTGHITYEME